MPPTEELERLLRAVAREEDRTAFARLFEHFAPRIKGFMMGAGCDAALAEEIAQDTLVTVWHKAALFDPRHAAVSTWVFTIARNRRIDLHRRRSGGVQVADTDGRDLENEILDPADRPEEQLWASQQSQRVRDALAALPAEQALIVRMSFFEENPHAEIARALGIPLGTVKSRIRLAVGQLRRLLDELR